MAKRTPNIQYDYDADRWVTRVFFPTSTWEYAEMSLAHFNAFKEKLTKNFGRAIAYLKLFPSTQVESAGTSRRSGIVELDGTYWFHKDDAGISSVEEPFSNLLHDTNLPRLLRDFDTWLVDMRLCTLREGKAIGSSQARTGTRDSVFLSRLKSSPNYQRNLRTQKTQGMKQYERLAKEAKTELRRMLRQFHDGSKSFAELQRDSADFFEHFYARIWEAGRKASGLDLYVPEANPTRKEKEWLRSATREELQFWQSFLKEVKAGDVPFKDDLATDQATVRPPQRRYTVEERLAMYLEGLQAVFENGRVSGMPNNLLFYWFGPKPGEKGICRGCAYIVERQPFTKDTLPAVPRSGATPCLTNCRHKLVVRQATLKEVERRRAKLPKRESMVRALANLKESKPRHRVKGKLVNPWQK